MMTHECSICLEEMLGNTSRNKDLIQLPCGHLFHSQCIFKTFCTPSRNCPNCRYTVNEEFPMQCVLRRLLFLFAYKGDTETSGHILWTFNAVLASLYHYPNSVILTKPLFLQVMQGVDSLSAKLYKNDASCTLFVPKQVYTLFACGHQFDADNMIIWLTSNNNNDSTSTNSCPICRVELPKDITMDMVLQRLRFVLTGRKVCWHVYWLFKCICGLVLKDSEIVVQQKDSIGRTVQDYVKFFNELYPKSL